MALVHDCIACQHGAHDKHIAVPGPVPEGIIGGWVCDCKGECRDRPRPKSTFVADTTDYEAVAALLAPFEAARASREPDLTKEDR